MLMKVEATKDDVLKQRTEELLPVGDLKVIWPDAQQPFVASHAEGIAKEFNWELLGAIIVIGPLLNGKYHIVDGQHRVDSVLKLFGAKETVPCLVYPTSANANVDKARAAWLFHEINLRRRRPKAIDLFRTAVTAGHEPEVTIHKIVKTAGFALGGASNGIAGVKALEFVHRLGGSKLLLDTLVAIRETWGAAEATATDAVILRVFATFLHSHKQAIRARLYSQVSKTYTPAKFLGAVKTASDAQRMSTTQAGKDILTRVYDVGLRTGRLSKQQDK